MTQLVKNPLAMQDTCVRSLGWKDYPEDGKGFPFQYSGLENSMNCIVHGVAKGWTQLSDFMCGLGEYLVYGLGVQ